MRLTKKLFAISVFSITSVICGHASGQDWKIGLIAPTTGPLATVGARQLSTFQWWESEVNAKGIKGKKVQVIHCNDEASPEKAVTCARQLLGQGIVLLVNSSVTGPIRATMPLVKSGPVMLTPSPNILPEASSFVFQTSPSDADLVLALAEYAKANGVSKIGMIAATDASGEVGAASAAAVFPKQGLPYNLARIDPRATDASIQLARVAGPDVPLLYSTYTGGNAITVIKSYSNLGLPQPIVVSFGNISDPFIALMKNDMPKRLLGTALKAVAPELLTDTAERERTAYFSKSYAQFRGGERADMLNLVALGLVDTAESVLRNVQDPTNAESVKKYLESTPIKSFQTIRFSSQNHVGLGAGEIAILELKGDRWVKADPVK
jgi:branched-chain amino acid transport system substrate-binding protein